jgi:F-type H+-transporting ATPase subunit epsilon
MHLEIISPEKTIFSGEASLIQFPGALGSFELLNNHAPIVSTLARGQIKVKSEHGDIAFFEIENGVVESHKNQVSALVETR